MVFSDFMNEFDYLYEEFVFGQYTQFIVMSFSVVTFVGLLYIRKGLQLTLRSGIFNDKSSIDFKFAAKFLLLSGILSGIFNIISFIHSLGIYAIASFGQDLLLIILSFVLFIVADIIKNGNELKIDNELTV